MSQWVAGELEFAAIASKAGFDVLIPYDETLPYDLVIVKDGHFAKIQVKTTSVFDEERDRYRVHVSKHGHSYTTDETDYICCQTPLGWYIIPTEKVTGVKSISLYPHRGSNGEYELYRNRWDLLST